MKNSVTARAALLAGAALLLIGAAASGTDTVSQQAMADRFMKECMKKQPSTTPADEALRTCKAEVDKMLKDAKREELSKGPATLGPPGQ